MMICLLLLLQLFTSVKPVHAQVWRIKTPRDTVKVFANQSTTVSSKLQLASPLQAFFTVKGTYGLWPGQKGAGIDAAYTYSVPNWNAAYPLVNPPSYGGTSYDIYLAVDGSGFGALSPIKVRETSFQASHVYTAIYTSAGPPFTFKIKTPNNSYYAQGSGNLSVEIAQYTAGICLQKPNLDFSSVAIGTNAALLDSISSYGVDPLQVDSVRLSGSADFSFTSERGDRFVLPNESTNQFRIVYSPSSRTTAFGFLFVYSHNTDGLSKVKTIALRGVGTAPTLAIGPTNIDFGRVRVKSIVNSPINVYNGGNGILKVTKVTIVPEPGTPANIFTAVPNPDALNPLSVPKGSNKQIGIYFAPKSRATYRAKVFISGQGVPTDSVSLVGVGAEPIPVLSDTVIDFGKVRRGDMAVRTVTLRNIGNWTANCILAQLNGPNVSAFAVTPNDKTFLLNADSTRTFTLTFQPATGPEGSRFATLELAFDDGQPSKIVTLFGTEIEPKLFLNRTAIDFGKVKVYAKKRDSLNIKNISNATLSLQSPQLMPLASPPNFLLSNVVTTLAGLSDVNMYIDFQPTRRGYFSAKLFTAIVGQRDSILLTGFGAEARPKFDPPSLDYGIVPSGTSSTLFTHLTDTGDYPLKVVRLEVTGPDAADFTRAAACTPTPFRVDSTDFANLAYSFTTNAKTGAIHTAQLCVVYEDSTRDCIELVAREEAQFVQFAQRSIDFGKVRILREAHKPAIFSNGSNSVLTVGNIWIDPDAGVFSRRDTTTSVDPKKTSNVDIAFFPTSRGSFTGLLHADKGNIKADSIELRGVGAAPIPQFSDTLIDFGTVINPGNSLKLLTLTNIGDWTMAAKIYKINDRHNEFSFVKDNLPISEDSVFEASKSDYTITFAPNQPVLLHTAELLFEFDDGSTQLVHLIGRDETKFLAIDSGVIDFGLVRVPGPATKSMQIVNTSLQQKQTGTFAVTPATGVFTIGSAGPLVVESRTALDLAVRFTPPALGPFTATLFAKGGDMESGGDSVLLKGVGASPIPKLSEDIVNFGLHIVGTSASETVLLINQGNWPLQVDNTAITGPNAGDFTSTVPQNFTIAPGDTLRFNVTYLATTPIQNNPRLGQVDFVEDNGETFKLLLTAQDKAPYITEFGFDNFLARPGDHVYPHLRLRNAIPAALKANDIKGDIFYDPSVVELVSTQIGNLMSDPRWTFTGGLIVPGHIAYQFTSKDLILTDPGSLLRFDFLALAAPPGSQTILKNEGLAWPQTNELTAIGKNGSIVIDSTCGSTHLFAGPSMATFVRQNSPNPFGGSLGDKSTIEFDVAPGGAMLSLRILDAAGREFASPIENRWFEQGHYSVVVDARDLAPGVYVYQFIAPEKTTLKKMLITR